MQNAPLKEQQQIAIVALSHVVAEQPYPTTLKLLASVLFWTQDHISRQENGGLVVTSKDSAFRDSQAIEAVLVNTNQVSGLSSCP
ncbi:hypothetical protein JCGZ_23644 [Jatropha curcas]|uniref:Uncharacterized protein n=1 Tax=Jatropha curcas TaxID=180498 RepID=A0A067LF65_JATCU|nr:hypothetical protein JCGZ_23644 [Jatropha curcas]